MGQRAPRRYDQDGNEMPRDPRPKLSGWEYRKSVYGYPLTLGQTLALGWLIVVTTLTLYHLLTWLI